MPAAAEKARIRRATLAAQNRAEAIDATALEQLAAMYQLAFDELIAVIEVLAIDGLLREQQLGRLLQQTDAILERLGSQTAQHLPTWLLDAAESGIQPFLASASPAIALQDVPRTTVDTLRRFVHADGLTLSARLHGNTEDAKARVRRHLTRAIVSGQSASEAVALDLLEQGRLPREVQAAIRHATPAQIRQALKNSVLDTPDSPYQVMRRVYRTEINRAFGTAYNASAESHPDSVGLRFLLSPRHPEPDICDMHARVNRWGLGAGGYPFENCPWPAHPNTFSYTEVIFADEVSAADRAGKESRIDWLNKQSPAAQISVLGRNKAKALLAGILTERQITTPWYLLKKRYEKTGQINRL